MTPTECPKSQLRQIIVTYLELSESDLVACHALAVESEDFGSESVRDAGQCGCASLPPHGLVSAG